MFLNIDQKLIRKIYAFLLNFERAFRPVLAPKFNQNIDRFFDGFCNGFFMILGSFLGSKTHQKSVKFLVDFKDAQKKQ